MLEYVKGFLRDWVLPLPRERELSPLEQHEANKTAAYSKALALLSPESRECFEQTLNIAAMTNSWGRYSPTLFNYIDQLPDEYQIAVMAKLVPEHMPIIGTPGFASWSRNHVRDLLDVQNEGREEFFERLAIGA